jgi:hypothetical protein
VDPLSSTTDLFECLVVGVGNAGSSWRLEGSVALCSWQLGGEWIHVRRHVQQTSDESVLPQSFGPNVLVYRTERRSEHPSR